MNLIKSSTLFIFVQRLIQLVKLGHIFFCLCCWLWGDPAQASCQGLKGERRALCITLKSVEYGYNCDIFNPTSISYSYCLVLHEIASGGNCLSLRISGHSPIGSAPSPNWSGCRNFLAGYSGEKCSSVALPPIHTRRGYIPQSRQNTFEKLCRFGAYVAKNHQLFQKRRMRHQVLQAIQSKTALLPAVLARHIQKLTTTAYPKISKYLKGQIHADEVASLFIQTMEILEPNRDLLVKLASTQTYPIYFKKGSSIKGHILPCGIVATPNGRLVIQLSRIHLTNRHLLVNPIGKGTFKTISLAIDYDTSELLAQWTVHVNPSAEAQMTEVIEEQQMQARWDSMLPFMQHFTPNAPFQDELGNLITFDKYYEYNLSEFTEEYLNNSLIETIEGRNKKHIKTDIMVSLLKQLNHIHSLRVHHRDIKPENILVDFDSDGRPITRIIDAGTAFDTTTEDETQAKLKAGRQVGSPLYFSPEYVRAVETSAIEMENYNLMTDVWAMGLTLWQMNNVTNLKIPMTFEAFILGLVSMKTYSDLEEHLGIASHQNGKNNKNELNEIILRMLDPTLGRGHRINTKVALALASNVQQAQISKNDPEFNFR